MDDELDVINEDIVKLATANNDDDKERSLLMPIDQAILKSIEACPTDEMKKKMYSSILIVGGGMKFRNADKFLMQKLALQVNIYLQIKIMANFNPQKIFISFIFLQSCALYKIENCNVTSSGR